MGIIKQILQGSIVLFIFKISGTASNFLVHILVSRVYGSTALGMYSLFISAMTFLSMFSIVGLDLYVIRKIAEIEDDCLSSLGFIRKSLRFVIIYSATLGCIVYFISPMLREHLFKHDLGRVYIILLSIIISIYSIQVVMSSVLRGFGDVVRYAIYQSFLVQVALLLVMVFLVLVINLRIDPAYVFCSVLTLIVCFQGWGLIRYICNRYHLQARQVLSYGKYAEKIIMYSWPMMSTSSGIFLMAYTNTFLVSYYLGVREVGWYSAIQKLSTPLVFFTTAVSSYLAPRIARSFVNKKYDQVRRLYYSSMKVLLTLSTPIFLALVFFPRVFLGLFGDEFVAQVGPLHIYNVSSFLSGALFGPIGYFLVMTDDQRAFQVIVLVAVCVNVLMGLVLVPKYGLSGAASATLLATVIWKGVGFLRLRGRGLA